MNCRYIDGQLELFEGVDIGLMIGLKNGLVAPVIRDVQRMSLEDVGTEVRRLRRLAEAGDLTSDEMRGGGLSISNLGMHGVDCFAGIIQPGQSSLLSIGRVRKLPRYVDDRLEPRSVMSACLSVDHRVTDGIGAGAFMAGLKQKLESWSAEECSSSV